MNYENRITAFIDILGFKDILNKTVNKDDTDNESEIDDLVKAYNSIRSVWDLDSTSEISNLLTKTDKSKKKITTFSDCVVVSFPVEKKSEIFYTLLEIKWMILRLVSQNILCRGAISYGKLIHTDAMLFGPALVEAYVLESKAANYPRIILDRNIIELAGNAPSDIHTPEDEMEYVESLLEKDLDGMYYIDYFEKAQEELDDPQYDFPTYIDTLGKIIRKGMNTSKHPSKAAIKVKYVWMKEKYNNMVRKSKNKDFLNALKDGEEFELYEYYKKLKQINPTANNIYDAIAKSSRKGKR